jgi:hypothetical protein
MDFFATVGSALTNRIDIAAIIGRYFPSHDRFTAWRDAGGHCPGGLLPDREKHSQQRSQKSPSSAAPNTLMRTNVLLSSPTQSRPHAFANG